MISLSFESFFIFTPTFRTINAGKSVRNEDHASVYRGTLRAIVSDENISSKVSDMMPTVPGYPHQIPVGNKKSFVAKSLLKTMDLNQKSDKSEDKIDNKSDVKQENGIEEKPKTSDSTSEDKSLNTNEDPALPLKSAPNLNDLVSPSTPIPLEIRLSEAAAEIVESAYATPQSSPEKVISKTKEEALPWLYFAVFDGHAGQSLTYV